MVLVSDFITGYITYIIYRGGEGRLMYCAGILEDVLNNFHMS